MPTLTAPGTASAALTDAPMSASGPFPLLVPSPGLNSFLHFVELTIYFDFLQDSLASR